MPRNPDSLPLTDFQMKFLWGEEEPSNPDDGWYEVRQRVRHTLMNGEDLWSTIPTERRRQIFHTVSDGELGQQSEKINEIDNLYSGLTGWLAFLYAGIEDADHAHTRGMPGEDAFIDGEWTQVPQFYFDFEWMLEDAVKKVAESQGERVTEFSLEVETEPISDPEYSAEEKEEIQKRVRKGDPDLDRGVAADALQRGIIAQDEFWSWHDRQEQRTPSRRGHSGPTDILDDDVDE